MMHMLRTSREYGHVLTDALKDVGPETRIVDVREPDEYSGDLGHIPGAELVPLDRLASAATDWNRAQPVLVVCERGSRSIYAAALLTSMGFRQVGSLVGGMLAYRDSGLSVAAESHGPHQGAHQ
jgi:rhodanese-related sulfurtransferase